MANVVITATAVIGIPAACYYLFVLIRGLYRIVRDLDLTVHHVSEMKTNHLPHIYSRLGRIDDRLSLPRVEPPTEDDRPN